MAKASGKESVSSGLAGRSGGPVIFKSLVKMSGSNIFKDSLQIVVLRNLGGCF